MKVILLMLSTLVAYSMAASVQQTKPPQVIRIHAQGGTPFDSDILLPYSIIQNILQHQLKHKPVHFHSQIRAIISPTQNRKQVPTYSPRKPYSRQSRTFLSSLMTASAASSQFTHHLNSKLHFEKDHLKAKSFRLYDDDGEYLLDLSDLSQAPIITNVTTSYKRDLKRPGGGGRSPKKLVKHIWINL